MIKVFIPPIPIADLTAVEELVRKNQSIVGRFPGDIYHTVEYRDVLSHGLKEFYGFLDRNAYTRIAALSRAEPIPESQLDDHRWAAAIVAFSQLAGISFDYRSSLHEFAATHSGEAAVHDMAAFYRSDNASLQSLVDFAIGRSNSLPTAAFRKTPAFDKQLSPEVFSDPGYYDWCYLYALKIADIGQGQETAENKFVSFLEWMRDEFFIGAPATMWASTYFSRGSPLGMLDVKSKSHIQNVAWDITMVQEWGKRALWSENPATLWLLVTRDRMMRSLALKLIAESKTEAERYFVEDWGRTMGKRIANHHFTFVAKNKNRAISHERNPETLIPKLTLELQKKFWG